MALAAHLVRRTATYYWRRRLPAALGAKVLLISLRTSDPARARRLGPLVTAESNRAFDDFAAGKADYEAVLAHLQMVIRRESMDLATEAAPRPAIARSEPIPARPKADPYGPALKALVGRLMDQKRAQGMSEAQVGQMTKVYGLFSEITGVRDIRQIKQAHIAQFVDVLRQLPPTYRKSPKDAKKPLSQIISENKGPAGLSTTTINRNLDYLNQLFTKARSEGFANVASLDLSGLRQRKTTRDRDDRPAFTAPDLQKLFLHPVWQGRAGKGRWTEAGTTIIKDGLYWLPIIAALTGARREEIAGLKQDDLQTIDGIPALHIRANANRGLKTLSSARALPLHPQLIELGLLGHAALMAQRSRNQGDLFPDLRRKSGGKFGEAIDYRFRMVVAQQLGDAGHGKVFHSFRHYVATQLGRLSDVKDQTRADILGHAGGSITAERYSEPTPLPIMLNALSKLPTLPIKS
ncbi:site-specific integrase [Paracoccus sp. PS-1]|uniref:site-specific integrase n=1 Tax=Paracoccus sp. PS1 TaxID=2963938 RepID=UPI0027E4725E|nr:site-specific integrase [Paracoccus sp. PS1]MDQ7263486.1 site-specific integrase [Paracoccus sp. PS1]